MMKKAAGDLTPVMQSRGFTGLQLFAVSINKMILAPHPHCTFAILSVI